MFERNFIVQFWEIVNKKIYVASLWQWTLKTLVGTADSVFCMFSDSLIIVAYFFVLVYMSVNHVLIYFSCLCNVKSRNHTQSHLWFAYSPHCDLGEIQSVGEHCDGFSLLRNAISSCMDEPCVFVYSIFELLDGSQISFLSSLLL